eukprot:168366-Pelagomonas_calceolata.AAC.1
MPPAKVSTASVAGLLQRVSSFLVCLADVLFRLLRKVVASSCAGSRVWRTPSSFWRIPCARSCKDCAKVVWSESPSATAQWANQDFMRALSWEVYICKDRNMNFESDKECVGYKWDIFW